MTRNALLISALSPAMTSSKSRWMKKVAVTHYITVGPARLLWVLVTDTPNPGHQCDHFLCSCRTFFSLVKDQNGSTKHKTEIVFGITVSFIHYVIQCVWTSIVHHRHLHCFIIGDDKVKWSTKPKNNLGTVEECLSEKFISCKGRSKKPK